jgi:hypothetical protein
MTSEFEVKRCIVYLSSLILEEVCLRKWPRFKEECMDLRGLLPLLLVSITPMCAKGVVRKKA